jgi:hypothetical protein
LHRVPSSASVTGFNGDIATNNSIENATLSQVNGTISSSESEINDNLQSEAVIEINHVQQDAFPSPADNNNIRENNEDQIIVPAIHSSTLIEPEDEDSYIVNASINVTDELEYFRPDHPSNYEAMQHPTEDCENGEEEALMHAGDYLDVPVGHILDLPSFFGKNRDRVLSLSTDCISSSGGGIIRSDEPISKRPKQSKYPPPNSHNDRLDVLVLMLTYLTLLLLLHYK